MGAAARRERAPCKQHSALPGREMQVVERSRRSGRNPATIYGCMMGWWFGPGPVVGGGLFCLLVSIAYPTDDGPRETIKAIPSHTPIESMDRTARSTKCPPHKAPECITQPHPSNTGLQEKKTKLQLLLLLLGFFWHNIELGCCGRSVSRPSMTHHCVLLPPFACPAAQPTNPVDPRRATLRTHGASACVLCLGLGRSLQSRRGARSHSAISISV